MDGEIVDGQELKEALLQRTPVTCNGIEYAYISGIIYRAMSGKIKVTVELMDKNNNSVVITVPKNVHKCTSEHPNTATN